MPKPSSSCPAIPPPQASTTEKGHGRIEVRRLWCQATEPQTIGLAGVAQVVRIQRHIQEVRKGQVTKTSTQVVFAISSLWPEEAGSNELLHIARDHWSIENGQHHRRDRTQD